MEQCFLCLESVESFNDCIQVDSEKWKAQDINESITKHLWPMEQINPTSWLCVECAETLHGFHKFYYRIKSAQHKHNAVLDNCNGGTELDIQNCLYAESTENLEHLKNDYFNKNSFVESHIEPHITLEQHLPTEFVIDGPYIKVEQDANLCIHDKKSNENGKRGRSTKDISLTTNEHREDPLTKLKKINRSSRSKTKALVLIEDDIKKNENDSNSKKFKNLLASSDIKDSLETDSEQHDAEGQTETKRKNHRNLDEKTLKEYDRIIAENFKIFCNLCQLEFDNFLSLRRHFKIEHKQRGYARCCKRNFFTRSLLVDHIHVHLNPDYFKCYECSKVFSDRSRLLCHKKLHEDDSKLDKCNICEKLFADKGALKKHVLTHSSQKLFPCTICGKFFTNSFILNHHIEAVHQNKFVQICEICGKSIRCPTAFASHMEKHEVKTTSISCDICGLLLTNKEGLKRHKNSQHPEGGKKEHSCHICSKVSPTQRALKSHIRSVHEQGFDFKCSLCEKSFKRPAVLKEHMATHTGTALYSCLWCPRTFISNGNMYNHRKNAHPKEWEELKRQKYAGNVS